MGTPKLTKTQRDALDMITKHGGGVVAGSANPGLRALERKGLAGRSRDNGHAAHWKLTEVGRAFVALRRESDGL